MLDENLYCCDNLEFAKALPEQSIDLIYSDILFNTGNTFGDYADKLGTNEEVRLYYLERFWHFKKALKSTGSIFIHCDYRINYIIRDLMEAVFVDGFRNEIIWKFNSAPRKRNNFGVRHNTIYWYSVSNDYYFDETSPYVREPYAKSAPRGYSKEKYYHPDGKILGSVWDIPMIGQNDKTERVDYNTQKPIALLLPIIDACCPKDGIVADFFMGSGTTMVAAKKLGRLYIGCDINPKSIEITNERLQKMF